MATIHLTNWSSSRFHTPIRLTIMAAPRAWEHGEGCVQTLVPEMARLEAVKKGRVSPEAYLDAYEARLRSRAGSLAPGRLTAVFDDGTHAVRDGSTLCCSCSRAEASQGRCHRVIAARWLERSGWTVVLDGVRLGQPAAKPAQLRLFALEVS